MNSDRPSSLPALLRRIGLLTVVSLTACVAPTPTPRTVPRPPPPVDPCVARFDPCTCDIGKFSIPELEVRIRQPSATSWQRQEKAANFSDSAVYYKNKYWQLKKRDDGLRALRFYDAYLALVTPSDPLASYALLHSIAIYCDLDCGGSAQRLTSELRRGYRYEQQDLAQSYSYCRR